MFGFGLQKILLLAAIVGAVWYGFKFFSRLDASKNRLAKTARKVADEVVGRSAAAEPAVAAAQDMERCETCGDFVTQENVKPCGREACPYIK